MKLGILILHYNTPEVTTQLARSIPEAIIIDNGSTKSMNVPNRIITLPKNYGFTKGWNEGIKAVYDEYDGFWLLNSDIEISKETVEQVKQHFEKQTFDIFSPQYNSWLKDCQPGVISKPTSLIAIEFCAPVIAKRVIEAIGYMDEDNFPRGYGVEFDYCYRARQAGFTVGVIPDSEFYHIGSQTIQMLGFKDYVGIAKQEHNAGLVKKYGNEYWKTTHLPADRNAFEWQHKNGIAVYTTIFGDYDTLKPHAWSQIPAKWVCVTDNPNLRCEGWIIHVVKPRFEDPRKNAKFYKMFPWEVEPIKEARMTIFVDGSIKVTSEVFIEWFIIRLYNDMLVFNHPYRQCPYEEAIVSEAIKYYSGPELRNQVREYRHLLKPNSGLWACGVLVRKHTDFIKKLMSEWWEQNLKYTLQDQISFAYVCAKNKFKPTTLKENLYYNQLFKIIPHMNTETHLERKTPVTDRIRVINSIIKLKEYETYLEIGMADGATFLNIQCRYKDAIEIKKNTVVKPIFCMSSDEFFQRFKGRLNYDLIFIDGDHERGQVLRDIKNSLDILNPGGCLVLHDTNPPNEKYTSNVFCYNAYQALIDIIFEENKLQVYQLTLCDDQGNGLGFIIPAKKKFPILDAQTKEHLLTYQGFDELRKDGSGVWVTEDELYLKLKKK